MKPKPELWWVLRAQCGDKEALDELLRSVQRLLYGYLCRMMGDRSLAEDVLQEVLLTVYRQLKDLRDPSLLRPWVFRIASRAAFRQLAKEGRWREQVRDEEVLAGVAAEGPASDGLLSQLPDLMQEVSPASRAVLDLHYLQGMSLPEVAVVLDIALGTVKSRLAYGLKTLRTGLNEA